MEFTKHEKDMGRGILRTHRALLAEAVAWGQLEGSRFKGVLSRIVKASNDVVDPNKDAEGALTARGVSPVSILILGYPAILRFISLFTSSLSTLHCLRQVYFLSQNSYTLQNMWWGMKLIVLFKRCCICGSSVHRIAGFHTTMWTKLNLFWTLKICNVIIR